MDQIVFSTNLPKPGETVSNGKFLQAFGGKGANQAVAARRAGGQVTIITSVGSDKLGEEVTQNFEKAGVVTTFVKIQPDVHTGVALIMVDSKGENCISVALGANDLLSLEMVELAFLISETDYSIALFQMEAPIETVSRSIEYLFQKQIPIVLNLAPFCSLPQHTLEKVGHLVVNSSEAEALSSFAVYNQHSATKSAEAIFEQTRIPNIIITMGGNGVLLCKNGLSSFFSVPKVEVVDTTAAGDVFCGYLVHGLSVGKSIEEAIQVAIVAASIAVKTKGAQPSIPGKEIVDRFLKDFPVENA